MDTKQTILVTSDMQTINVYDAFETTKTLNIDNIVFDNVTANSPIEIWWSDSNSNMFLAWKKPAEIEEYIYYGNVFKVQLQNLADGRISIQDILHT